MWNESLNLFYAESIKRVSQDILVVFGGPNLSIDEEIKKEFVRENRCVDIYVEGDGEIASVQIVRGYLRNEKSVAALKRDRVSNTYSCVINDSEVEYFVGEKEDFRIGIGDSSLDDIPSPYLSGRMDKFFEDGSIPLLESNRGCPYACTFCQQATKYFSKMRYYSARRIYDELVYIYKKARDLGKKISIVEFSDPNFGMYKNDEVVFDCIRKVQSEFQFPREVWCSTGKSQANRILDNASKLIGGSIMIRAAVQSMNGHTLTAVKRKNLPVSLFGEMSDSAVDIYSDVMLGLPEESYKTYILGYIELIDLGVDEFSMPTALILKGTPMEGRDYRDCYGLAAKYRVIPECSNEYIVGDVRRRISEFELMITDTSSLSFDDYIQARKFNLIVQVFHNTRLLRPVYVILDSFSFSRSDVFRRVADIFLNSGRLSSLLDLYVSELKEELFDFPDQTAVGDKNVFSLTSNKVFKYLTIALLDYKCELLDVIKLYCHEIEDRIDSTVSDAIVDIVDCLIPDEMCPSDKKNIFDIHGIGEGDGIRLEVGFSDYQNERMEQMLNRYPDAGNFKGMMAYHMRPANMIKAVRYV